MLKIAQLNNYPTAQKKESKNIKVYDLEDIDKLLDGCLFIKINRPDLYTINIKNSDIHIMSKETQKGIIARFESDEKGYELFTKSLKTIAGLFPLSMRQVMEYQPDKHFSGFRPSNKPNFYKTYFGDKFTVNNSDLAVVEKFYNKAVNYINTHKPSSLIFTYSGNSCTLHDRMEEKDIATHFLPNFKSKIGALIYELFPIPVELTEKSRQRNPKEPLFKDYDSAKAQLTQLIKEKNSITI